MSTKEQFELAASIVKDLKAKPTDDELLSLYALYKQATIGDCNTDKPSIFNLKEQAKWKAWESKKGQKKESAMKEYTELVMKLGEKYGVKN